MKHKHEKVKNRSKTKKVIIIILVIIIAIILLAVGIGFLFINNKIGKMKFDNKNYSNNELGISDQQAQNLNNFRTDCIMIASINKTNNNISLFSIYRDTLVQMELDGKVRLDKINHAYYGGVENTLKTINTNFDLNVTEYVMIDFKSVADLVDKVGGVEINITSEELKYINDYIKWDTSFSICKD